MPVYHDTEDAVLTRLGVTLERGDDGWRLRVPMSTARQLITDEARTESVPEGMLHRVAGVVGDRRLRRISDVADLYAAAEPTSPGRPAGELGRLVATYAHAQCVTILLGDITLRDRPDDDTVHDTRVAIRRLRSMLRSLGPAFEPGPAVDLFDSDLRELARVLGAVRDSDVVAARLLADLERLPPTSEAEAVRRSIVAGAARERREALETLQATWRSDRYRRTMAVLVEWLDKIPVAGAGQIDPDRLLDRAKRSVKRRLAGAAEDPDELHRARKAAKRLRYTGEALAELVPRGAKLGDRAKRLQQRLGDHQDLVVAADRALTLAQDRPSREAFVFGMLYARALQQAADVRAALDW